jgi:capsular exopolysaccharide synthesis family protein
MKFLRRYVLWIVLATVACIAGAWGIAAHQPVQFATAAVVDVEANSYAGTTPATVNPATEQTVATSGAIVDGIAPKFGLTPDELFKHLSASNQVGTNILLISCSMPTATTAQSCANAIATAYRNYTNYTGKSKAIQAHDPLNARIVTFAPLPSAQSGKRKVELLALGVILGLALGVGTAFLRDRLDDRVRDRADLGQCLDAPVLGDIPALGRRSGRPETAVITDPQSPSAEAYRHLRARISPLIDSTDSRGKVLLVTSSQAGEGSAAVASNLAAVMALAGVNVLLVDADLRHQSLSKAFRVGEQPGLTDLLTGRAKLDDAIILTDVVPGLRFMPAGTITDRPADLLDASRLRRAFSRITVVADVVIVNSAPLQPVSDGLALTPVSDIVMLVAALGRTRRGTATATAQEIREIGPVMIVGAVNHPPPPWRRDLAQAEIFDDPAPTATLAADEPAQSYPAADAVAPGDPPIANGHGEPNGDGPQEVQAATRPWSSR